MLTLRSTTATPRSDSHAMHFASLPDHRAPIWTRMGLTLAISDGRESLTNAELLTRVRAASRHLRDLGIGAGYGSREIDEPPRIRLAALRFVADRRHDHTGQSEHRRHRSGAITREDSNARLLVIEDSSTARGTPTLAADTVYTDLADFDPTPLLDPSALSLLVYTSCTTGTPKASCSTTSISRPRRRNSADRRRRLVRTPAICAMSTLQATCSLPRKFAAIAR